MVKFSTRDAAILARVAQNSGLPLERRRSIVVNELNGDALQVGRLLLQDPTDARPDVVDAAEGLKSWAERTNKLMSKAYRISAG
jgi:hypothetical protein